MTDGARRALSRPVDAASVKAFRFLFGALMCGAMIRLIATGGLESLFRAPAFHFRYFGLTWVPHIPAGWLTAHVLVLAALALCVAVGLYARIAALLFAVGFAWLELTDVTTYLNHYYLVFLLALVLAVIPVRGTVPAWGLYLLRFQVGVVYFNAGLAKLNPDWLLHAQPLSIWLSARTETPIIGPWLDEAWVAHAASWAGFLFDTTVVLWLSLRRTRPFAYAVVCAFHGLTLVFFDIGIFPLLMTASALIFFPPDWPRRWLGRLGANTPVAPARPPVLAPVGLALAAVWVAFHLLFPLRHYLYPGDVSWNEEGMRWGWKVMLREKSGSVTFRVRDPSSGQERQVNAAQYLTFRQASDMAGQPDLILQLAHHVGRDAAARGVREPEVRADAWVSWNGRTPARLLDPEVDLMKVEDGLRPARWILPAPAEEPLDAFRAGRVARAPAP